MNEQINKIQKELRYIKIYAFAVTILFTVMLFFGFTRPTDKQKFSEIDVERINVVEKNGQLRAVISNTDLMPDPIINGKPFKTERPAGMIFYNGIGDECGGIVFGAAAGNGKYGAYGGFTFDQYKQSQSIGLIYNDHNGNRQVGLSIWDRPETSLSDLLQKREALDTITNISKKEQAMKYLRQAEFSPRRVFIGKNINKASVVNLCDKNGNSRIVLSVDSLGAPSLQFLDEKGHTTLRLTDSTQVKKN
jgi:hypothetical protein